MTLFGSLRSTSLAVVLLCAGASLSGQPPMAKEPLKISPVADMLAKAPRASLINGPLRAEILLPDAVNGFYRGTRFDWSGIVETVNLAGVTFYGPWFDGVSPEINDFIYSGDRIIVGPQTASLGPTDEFLSGKEANSTFGFDEAKAGGTFLKIGVGVLRRPDDRPYNRFRSYDIVDGGRWTVRRSASAIVFRHRVQDSSSGYGYDYTKTLTLDAGHILRIEYLLRNTGRRSIEGMVYNHNFTRFAGAPIGSGIAVTFPYPVGYAPPDAGLARIDDNALRYLRDMKGSERVSFPAPPPTGTSDGARFAIAGPNGMRIDIVGDTPAARVQLWSIRTTVALEPFVSLNIAPKGRQSWAWEYSFAAPGEAITKADAALPQKVIGK